MRTDADKADLPLSQDLFFFFRLKARRASRVRTTVHATVTVLQTFTEHSTFMGHFCNLLKLARAYPKTSTRRQSRHYDARDVAS